MSHTIIGIGNTGCQIVRAGAKSELLSDVKWYAIDSVSSNTDMDTIQHITTIPIVSDDKCGSGRNRERGVTMFQIHERNGAFNQMYQDAKTSKSPVIVISSAAGGTGSGVTPYLCKKLIDQSIDVIPIIIFPAEKDPDAFHLNTNDLMYELKEAGIQTYTIFRNPYGTANYTEINQSVVNSIEIILGKKYESNLKDDIDESDLNVVLNTPGRFIAVEAEATDIKQLKRQLLESCLYGFQPGWDPTQTNTGTIITAFSLKSPFASDDFQNVFSEIRERILHSFDEYRNIVNRDGNCVATIIISGLPGIPLKDINMEYTETDGIKSPAKKSRRPGFMNKTSTVRKTNHESNDDDILNDIHWT